MSQHEDVVQPQLLPPPFAGQPAIVLKHAHFSWGDSESDRGCTLQDISLKVRASCLSTLSVAKLTTHDRQSCCPLLQRTSCNP